ncbi:uncharacterized protein BDV17DRAFT_281085 [Aspergillus undulatus]|uniref:uncharacterized protein n=1 Tax=Aspergillus undulatus TaxID=1810928 RepID=UPI003CCDEA2C
MKLDLSLYLVTDSTPAILKGRDLCAVVEEACKGGVTVVQYRDKKSDTGVQIETARKLHRITQAHGVPLIINDRVDVALASGAEGVHLGQDDMVISEAKKLLPKDAIIGISASTIEEAQAAVAAGADYLGIGTLFATPTKTNTKDIIGTAGTQAILDAIAETGRSVGTVCIGGINLSNVQRVLYQSSSPNKSLDGAAIVSAIMAADDPRAAAAELAQYIASPPPFVRTSDAPMVRDTAAVVEAVPGIVQKLVQAHPLVHNMINFVVANFVANVTLAIGASPIMSPYGDEATDLCQFDGALLINMGTLTSQSPSEYLKAIKAYNQRGNPVVYDPVGAGATQIRRGVVKELMAGGYFDLIKGNEGEIRQVSGSTGVKQRGVDSGPSALDSQAKARLARDLARREKNIVLLTGATDYLSDGERVVAVENGHELLGQVTGTGCAVGTVAGCFMATLPTDKFLAVLSALLMYEIAAENAAAKDYVRGPGSFAPAFIDELYAIKQAALKGDNSWYEGRAKGSLHPAKLFLLSPFTALLRVSRVSPRTAHPVTKSLRSRPFTPPLSVSLSANYPAASFANMAINSAPESSLLSLLYRSYPAAISPDETEPDLFAANPKIFPRVTYTDAESADVKSWLSTNLTGLQDVLGKDDKSAISSQLASLNTHLATRTTVLGNKPSVADVAIYALLAPVVEKWSPEERTGEQGYHHIVRHVDFVQNSRVFSLQIPEEEKVAIDVNDVKFVPKPIDPKAEKERKKKEKAAAEGAAGAEKTVVVGQTKPEAAAPEAAAAGKAEGKPKEKKQKKEKAPKPPPAPAAPPSPSLIDLRVGHILRAINHPNADSLYVSTIDCGDAPGSDNTSLDEETGKTVRTVCSGLNGLVPLAEMQGRKIVAVCNLKPVTMRGIKSAAMVLAASPRVAEGEDSHAGPVELVTPPADAPAGDRIYFEGWDGEPEKQLNPKKKVWETFQPGFTTTDGLEVAFESDAVPVAKEQEGKPPLGKLVAKSGGVCTVKSLKAQSIGLKLVNMAEVPPENVDQTAQEQDINPWSVAGATDAEGNAIGFDYEALSKKWNTSLIDQALLDRFEKVTGHKPHRWLRRGLFFSHRDFDRILTKKEKGEPFFLYTGRGPSSGSLHLGHTIPLTFTKWLQDVFDVPLVFMLTDDEKALFKDSLTFEETHHYAMENAKEIIALGFDVKKTFIYSDLKYVSNHMLTNTWEFSKLVTFNQVRGAFGFDGSTNIGRILFPAVQCVAAFATSYPEIWTDEPLKERKKSIAEIQCLIPMGIDQDPYFRLLRENAHKMRYPSPKPALIHSKFLTALQGAGGKMSSSDPNSAIFMTDTAKQIKTKINKYAFSGGQVSIEDHRRLGGNPDVDVSYIYLTYFEDDDAKLEEIYNKYKSGELLTGELKALAIAKLQEYVAEFQERRKEVTDEVLQQFMTPRRLEWKGTAQPKIK